MSSESVIRAESVTKTFRSGRGELVVFQELSLDVRPGELIAIIGASGAGKSTLLHLLGGLDSPSAGKIYFGHQDLALLSEKELAELRNKKLGFVWQNPSLLPEFTAVENVAMPLLIRRTPKEEAYQAASDMLGQVGLSHRLTHTPGELSGGERQRAALARALVTRPACVLADEPTGNLDRHTAESVFELMLGLNRTLGTSFVIVTHDRELASRANRVLKLVDGVLQPE